jgi:hypothetical protein
MPRDWSVGRIIGEAPVGCARSRFSQGTSLKSPPMRKKSVRPTLGSSHSPRVVLIRVDMGTSDDGGDGACTLIMNKLHVPEIGNSRRSRRPCGVVVVLTALFAQGHDMIVMTPPDADSDCMEPERWAGTVELATQFVPAALRKRRCRAARVLSSVHIPMSTW